MPYRLAMSPCSDSYGNRTRVTAVKGRCLNRLTKEPYFLVPSKLHTEYADIRFFRSLTSSKASFNPLSSHRQPVISNPLRFFSMPFASKCLQPVSHAPESKLSSHSFRLLAACLPFWSSPRPISNSQLHTLPCFHLCPIYLVVFKGSY